MPHRKKGRGRSSSCGSPEEYRSDRRKYINVKLSIRWGSLWDAEGREKERQEVHYSSTES